MYHYRLILLFLLLVVTAGLFVQVSYKMDPVTAGRYFVAQVGPAVGMRAAVPENPYNTLAQQLEEKELELLGQEAALDAREELVQKKERQESKTIFYLITAFGVLLILILWNFYLDYRRKRST